MGKTLGVLHDFDDSRDFEENKLEDKLGKKAVINGKRFSNKKKKSSKGYFQSKTIVELNLLQNNVENKRKDEEAKLFELEEKKRIFLEHLERNKKKWWELWK